MLRIIQSCAELDMSTVDMVLILALSTFRDRMGESDYRHYRHNREASPKSPERIASRRSELRAEPAAMQGHCVVG